jgi:hypothetical protein
MYDIFISYRRAGGAQYARILQLMLAQRGYKVFLDYDELKEGFFGKRIKEAIAKAPVFMLVLSKDSLERCANEDDWVREEILCAVAQNKTFIPVNPDKSFTGIKADIPEDIRMVAEEIQYSEIDFGQALGPTIDLMIKNRLEPILGKRSASGQVDQDYDAAAESLRKLDAHNKFMKRLGIAGLAILVLIVLGACALFWQRQTREMERKAEQERLETLKGELEQKHSDFGLMLSPQLTEGQMKTIDDILSKMSPVTPSSMWMSQFEFTNGQWQGILGGEMDEATGLLPKTDVSYGEINMLLLDSLRNMTNIEFDLPSAEEWQYAAKGGEEQEGTLYAGSDDAKAVAWFKDNSGGKPHPCDGQQDKEPNILDLYDMSGNVAELCNTPVVEGADGVAWTVCGGHYDSKAEEVTVTSKASFATDAKDKKVGFRLIIRKP